MLISDIVVHHLVAAVSVVTGGAAVLFTVVDAASTQTWGVGSVVGLMVALVGIVFRTQQQQIRSQRVDLIRMARRIEHLETELDSRRGHL